MKSKVKHLKAKLDPNVLSDGSGRIRKSSAGRKPKAFTVFRRRLEAEKIEDAEYAFGLYVEVMRDGDSPIDLRLDCADWIANRVLGRPKERIEQSGELKVVVLDK